MPLRPRRNLPAARRTRTKKSHILNRSGNTCLLHRTRNQWCQNRGTRDQTLTPTVTYRRLPLCPTGVPHILPTALHTSIFLLLSTPACAWWPAFHFRQTFARLKCAFRRKNQSVLKVSSANSDAHCRCVDAIFAAHGVRRAMHAVAHV